MSKPTITKGSRIRAKWFQAKPLGSFALSGMQMKVTGSFVEVAGVCRHFRGDDPLNPTQIKVYVETEGVVPEGVVRKRPYGCTCEGHDQLVEINPDHIVGVD